MEFPPPSEQQVELAELDREIAHRQTELTALIARRMALTPLQQMPPPQGAPVPQHQGTDGAKVILALGAAVLIAAVASFAGFVWPHLTLPLRTAALTLLVVLLGAGALYAKPRLAALAEALAATAGVSTVVLTTWFYAASSTNEQPTGIGVALGIAALIVGAAAVAWRLQAWVWTASVAAPVAALYLTAGVEQHYLPAFLAAGLFALLSWKLHWPQLVWASGRNCVIQSSHPRCRLQSSLRRRPHHRVVRRKGPAQYRAQLESLERFHAQHSHRRGCGRHALGERRRNQPDFHQPRRCCCDHSRVRYPGFENSLRASR